ncbi:hypothetical protein DFJ73DRAFT_846111 [Zopfochytrium polystomum]|nr:hypothetical protein DFJ73DRAFT_846111 [Zopfochytrium polystomum]
MKLNAFCEFFIVLLLVCAFWKRDVDYSRGGSCSGCSCSVVADERAAAFWSAAAISASWRSHSLRTSDSRIAARISARACPAVLSHPRPSTNSPCTSSKLLLALSLLSSLALSTLASTPSSLSPSPSSASPTTSPSVAPTPPPTTTPPSRSRTRSTFSASRSARSCSAASTRDDSDGRPVATAASWSRASFEARRAAAAARRDAVVGVGGAGAVAVGGAGEDSVFLLGMKAACVSVVGVCGCGFILWSLVCACASVGWRSFVPKC